MLPSSEICKKLGWVGQKIITSFCKLYFKKLPKVQNLGAFFSDLKMTQPEQNWVLSNHDFWIWIFDEGWSLKATLHFFSLA